MKVVFIALVLVGLSLQNPYIPAPAEQNYCQADRNTDNEVQRIKNRMAAGYNLVQVQMLTRHGDRAPIEWLHSPVYNDTAIWNCQITRLSHENYDNEYHSQNRLTNERYMPGRQANKGNCGMGQLTQMGAHQHVLNGEKFRSMYIDTAHFLSEDWDSEEVYIRSGDQLRLVESAQSIFVGMYPPSNDNKVEQRQNIDLIDSEFDNMTPELILNQCPLAMKMQDLDHETDAYKNYTATCDQLEAQLEEIFQVKSITVNHMNDLIRSRSCHDFDITYGGLLSQQMIDQIETTALFGFTFFPNHTAINRFGMGSFLQEMVDYFDGHMAGQNDFKFLLFSGHDSSVWPFLDTLNIYDGVWPPLASHVVLEFWQDAQKNTYIEIIYNGRGLTQLMKGCNGNELCKYGDFLSATKDVRVGLDQFWEECYGKF